MKTLKTYIDRLNEIVVTSGTATSTLYSILIESGGVVIFNNEIDVYLEMTSSGDVIDGNDGRVDAGTSTSFTIKFS